MPALDDAVADHENAINLLVGEALLVVTDEHGHERRGRRTRRDARSARLARPAAVRRHRAPDRHRARRTRRQPTSSSRSSSSLDEEYRAGLADCERREIVTSHAAFGYLAAAYDLEQIALTGISPEAEPSPRALEKLVEEVREHDATTVFFETLVSPRLAETVAREAGAETAALDPVEGLSEDALAEGQDYLSVMRDNLGVLRDALGCR